MFYRKAVGPLAIGLIGLHLKDRLLLEKEREGQRPDILVQTVGERHHQHGLGLHYNAYHSHCGILIWAAHISTYRRDKFIISVVKKLST